MPDSFEDVPCFKKDLNIYNLSIKSMNFAFIYRRPQIIHSPPFYIFIYVYESKKYLSKRDINYIFFNMLVYLL